MLAIYWLMGVIVAAFAVVIFAAAFLCIASSQGD